MDGASPLRIALALLAAGGAAGCYTTHAIRLDSVAGLHAPDRRPCRLTRLDGAEVSYRIEDSLVLKRGTSVTEVRVEYARIRGNALLVEDPEQVSRAIPLGELTAVDLRRRTLRLAGLGYIASGVLLTGLVAVMFALCMSERGCDVAY
jgi:hypothetical protein